MDGFILAAGRGTRLRPLTDRVPKALVEVGGRPLLAHVATRLVAAGVDRLVVNLHHLGEQIEAYLATHEFGVPVFLSWEGERPLETGGALRHAAGLLRRDAPFLLHNVDVLTDLPLRELWEAQRREDALATVAVMERPTRRRPGPMRSRPRRAGARAAAAGVAAGVVLFGLARRALGQPPAPVPPAVAEQEARAAMGRLKSPYCPGLMLTACPTPQADALRDSLRALAAQGYRADALVEWTVRRHGAAVRAWPRPRGWELVAWLAPPALGLAGVAVLLGWWRRRRLAPADAAPPAALDPVDRARLEAALRDEGWA